MAAAGWRLWASLCWVRFAWGAVGHLSSDSRVADGSLGIMEADGRPAFVDYAHGMHCAEEVAAAVVETILVNGGNLLWQKYLERKAFVFATNTAQDIVTASLEMCFVAHDPGEEDMGQDWQLEEEPVPAEIDSWARMHLSVRQRPNRSEDVIEPGGSQSKGKDGRRRNRSRTVPDVQSFKVDAPKFKSVKSETRATSIEEETQPDPDEQELREAKASEESRARERKSKQLAAERAKEEERKKVEMIHQEMEKKLHTFDQHGNLIWIDEVKPDKLPRVQEIFPVSIRKDPKETKSRLENGDKADKKNDKTETAPNAENAKSGRGGDRRGDRGDSRRKKRPERKPATEEVEFPDNFAKLQHGQPPIMETMMMKPGVSLSSQGRSKVGPEPDNPNRQMSRKEYFFLAEKEVASDGRANIDRLQSAESGARGALGTGAGAAAGAQGLAASGSQGAGTDATGGAGQGGDVGGEAGSGGGPTAAQLVAAAMEEAGTASGPDGTLPPIPTGRGTVSNSAGGRRAGGADPKKSGGASGNAADGEQKGQVMKAPPAPSRMVRESRQARSVGHLPRAPRFHVPNLGGPSVYFAAPPPLGATMGHGLAPMKEAFFFPSPRAELNMARSVSDPSLKGRNGSERVTPTSRRAKGSVDDDGDDSLEGRIMVEKKSAAYRVMRTALGSPEIAA